MPKNIHKIDRFEGGINEGAAQRDIKENQAVDVKNLSIHTVGSLKVLGGFVEHEATKDTPGQEGSTRFAGAKPGYGLFSFQSDYKMLDGTNGNFLDGSSSLVGASKYLLLYNTDNGGSAAIFQNLGGTLDWSTDDLANEIDLGGAEADLVYYAYNGGVRIADASGTTGNSTQWLGVITPKVYGNHTPVLGDGGTGSGQTYQQYGIYYTRNEASVYRTSSETGTTSIGSTEARWLRLNASIDGAFPEVANQDGDLCCLNAIMSHTSTKAVDYHSLEAAGFGFANEETDTGTAHTAVTTAAGNRAESNMFWGVGMAFREGLNGTWMPTTSTRYKFYITTMYDDMTQESLPQLMAMYGAQQLTPDITGNFNYSRSGSTVTITEDTSTGGTPAERFGLAGFIVAQKISIEGFTTDTNCNTTDQTLTTVNAASLIFTQSTTLPGAGPFNADSNIRIFCGDTDYDYTADQDDNDRLSFRYRGAKSEIYFCDGDTTSDEAYEGTCNKYGTPGTNLRAWFNPIIKINGATHGASSSANNPTNSNCYVFGNGNAAAGATYGNPRISGFRIYWASNEDGYSTLYQIMEGDFVKGLKGIGLDGSGGSTGYAPWQHYSRYPSSDNGGSDGNATDTRTGIYLKADWPTSNRWIHPPRLRTYFENNHHEHDDTINVDYYKTAVVANDRVYIGNVVQTINGVQERFPDRILKSPYGQPDKFPSQNKLQVGDNDGDAIVHLATFADRILQFNNNVMYIINISQDQEYVEDIHKFKGVHHSASVCETDDGIVWANENGVYIYTGKEVRNILESQGSNLIDTGTWKNFITNDNGDVHPMVGYSAKKREVLVVDDIGTNGDGHMYIFNANTGGWTYAPSAVGDTIKTNFKLDYNNDLIYFDYSDDKMRQWDNTASQKTGTGAVQYTTKEIDFGQPAIRKKIYKVYVTHKGSASNMQMSYAINGETTFTNVGSTFPESANSGAGYTTTGIDMNISGSTDVYTMQLKFTSTGTVPANFEINDISIVYRSKTIK